MIEDVLLARKALWLGHGHNEALYGDDGEMQCSRCIRHGTWDYKNAPMENVISAALAAAREAVPVLLEEVARLRALLAQAVAVIDQVRYVPEQGGDEEPCICETCEVIRAYDAEVSP